MTMAVRQMPNVSNPLNKPETAERKFETHNEKTVQNNQELVD